MERFIGGTRIVAGEGVIPELAAFGAKRLLVVSDPYFYKNGWAEKVGRLSGAEQVEYFHQVAPDPSVALAAEGTAAVRRFQPDTVVALGGGSAMDCAKAMVYFSGCPVRFIAIPTTSGSGSEVTDFAILTHEGVKHPLVDERLRPDAAILEGELVAQLPAALVADGGFDVISHAVEAYAATGSGAITDALAKEAFVTAYSQLPDSFRGSREARLPIHKAATMAGMAFTQAGLGVCHAMAHSLGGAFHIPHGRLNAILLPEVIERNAPAAGEKYAALAAAAGLGSAKTMGARNLKNGLIRLRKALDLPGTLAQAGIDPVQVRRRAGELAAAALEDPCCDTNPVKPSRDMVLDILQAVTGHG